MPRTARVKSYDSIYHIMVRSVGDTILFKKDEDKDALLDIVKHYSVIVNKNSPLSGRFFPHLKM